MRFLELSLIAYGAFRERRFDLSAPAPALHVLYGANEAGKSTALRAILGVLYGIDRRTQDAYLHGNANLRIGARLSDASGRELSVVRRKGDKDTLLDAHGAVLDETQLQRLLCGMQEGVFRSMFGLDHARLRKGGEQLRLGQGDLGESLFQAGVGTPGLSGVMRELSLQAEELFRPRGKRPLNAEIDAFRKAQRAVGEHGKRAESLRLQEQELETVEEQRFALQRRRNEMLEEQGRLQRVKGVLPRLAQRRELLERRAQLGELPLLPEDGDERRRSAQAERFACATQLVQLDRAHESALQRRAALVVSDALLELSADYVRAIGNRLGGILKAEQDLPSRRAELRALEQDARSALRALADPLPLEEVGALRLAPGTAALIGKLAREHGGLRERVASALRDEEAGQDALQRAARELAPLRSGGESEAALPDGAALPSQAVLELFRARFERAESTRVQLDDAFAALDQREANVEQELDRIAREGSPPTERELGDARVQRDRLWAAIRAGERTAAADLDDYARLTQAADAIADRLRREASRVAELARREAERAALGRERARLDRRRDQHAAEARALDGEWSALWAPLGLRPRTVAEMQPLLAKIAGLIESGERGRSEAGRRRAEAEAALVSWQGQWAELMARLRLRPDATVEEAQAVHDEQRALLEKVERIDQLRGRIEKMERDRRNFECDVQALVQRHLPELGALPLEQAAEQLVRRHAQAQRDLELRASIERELSEIEAQRAQLRDRDEQAARVLQELMRAARAGSLEELEQVEQRCRQLRALERELAGVEHDLLEFGEGAGIDELAAQAAEQSGERVRARLEELREELEAQEGERQELDHKIGRLRQGLELVKRDDLAAQSAAEAEQHLARIKSYAQSYVRRRLAVELLERELRRYRDANQGPIVGRASALFARLTLGRYPRLEVGYDETDTPVLQCVDERGTRVQVEGLSDGARDQLYLALRLASLERFAERNEPMPLVLDDVLIHFDEQRARAALAVLADFSATAQVLFFTHSARLCELARETVPADRLFEHRLGDGFPTVPVQLELTAR